MEPARPRNGQTEIKHVGKEAGVKGSRNRQGTLFILPCDSKHSAHATENIILFYFREYLFR